MDGAMRRGWNKIKRQSFILTAATAFAVMALFAIVAPKDAHSMGTLLVQEHTSIAPSSIPRDETPGVGGGTVNLGMTRLRFTNDTLIGSPVGSISSITVELTGTTPTSDIQEIKVYYEGEGGNGLFDRGGADDLDAAVGGPYSFDAGTTKTIGIDPTIVKFTNNDSVRLYVAFEFAATSDITGAAGCEITSVVWGPEDDGTGNTRAAPADYSLHGIQQNVDDYEVDLVTTGIAPAEAPQGSTRVGLVKLVFSALDTDVTANIDSIRLHRVGTGADTDIATGGVFLYDDSGTTPGSFDAGDQEVTAGSLAGGYVTLNPGTNLPVTSTGATYFVAVNTASNAQVFKTVGLEIENPSTHIVFNDVQTDPHVSVQYSQKGYITSTAATPGTSNTVLIPGGMNVQEYRSIAPSSIPRGTTEVGMAMLRFISSAVGTQSVSSITIELTGTSPTSDIQEIKVFYEGAGLNGLFDRGGADDVDALSGGPYSFDAGVTKTIDLDPNVVKFTNTGSVRLYVAFDFIAGADITRNAGCEITSVEWGPDGNGTGNTSSAPADYSLHGTQVNVDDYEVDLVATGIAPVPSEAHQSEQRVGILKLELSTQDTSVTAHLDALRFHRKGTGSDSDVALGGVILYDDSGSTPGSFDAGDQEVVAGSLSGGYALLNPSSNLPVTSAGATYFVALNIAMTAQVGETIGLEVEDPSNDVLFVDTQNNSYVSVQYVQEGYVVSSISTPSSGNTVTILVIDDSDAPTITYTDPVPNERAVSISTDITVAFSENIDPATVTSATFILKDTFNNQISGTISVSGTSATFSPNSDLDYDTIYTVNVTGGDSGVKDMAANPLASDYSWSFTTRQDVPKPIAANNRILPGSSDPVKIYIPEPAGGPDVKITVQVYTVTGKRVATLVDKRPYSQIKSQIPLLWYGKNGRQQNLGPGLYFIQVLSGSDKTVLKVLIVR